jgi:hypothetical protein
MKITIKQNQLSVTYPQFLRQAGYDYIENRHNGQSSFVRKLGGGAYPRFHIYVKEQGDTLVFNLHLDQKQVSYEGNTAHSGEYDDEGPVLAEGERLKSFFRTGSGGLVKPSNSNNPWSKFKK